MHLFDFRGGVMKSLSELVMEELAQLSTSSCLESASKTALWRCGSLFDDMAWAA
jgi:hypothetical protein